MDGVPRNTLRDKRAQLASANEDFVIDALAQGRAFITDFVPGKVLLIPTGMMVASCAVGTVQGMRWSVSGDDADVERVMTNIKFQMESFPELRKAEYGYLPFYDFHCT